MTRIGSQQPISRVRQIPSDDIQLTLEPLALGLLHAYSNC